MTASEADDHDKASVQALPKPPAHKGTISKDGIILGPDGKPCRSCNSYKDMSAMSRMLTGAAGGKFKTPVKSRKDCPPDVEQLGRSTWTLLHSLTATYPETPTPDEKSDMKTFLSILSRVYPCWVCAEDFSAWMSKRENEPALNNQEDFGRWMCKAHNAVNKKLGKPEFDCNFWKERWRDGWPDGRCD
ncbi:hypothetical protein ABW19_dt0204350 [Dactylella cylindrospora]|nr:hypothetical protein ABW19_dt0204350 [Dactylella cylindrospora]